MNTFFAVALTLALCAVTFAQDPCDAQCAGVCSAGAALCIDIPSVVDCGALTAACTGVCKDTCTCTGACTASCASDAKACEEKSANTFTSLNCKGVQLTCESVCQSSCPGQALVNFVKLAMSPPAAAPAAK